MPENEFLPLSRKLSLSPLNEEEVSVSASELLYSELSEKNQLLEKAQKEALDYKLKCEALLSTLSENNKKRQREQSSPATPNAACPNPDEAPKKKPSPPPASAHEAAAAVSTPAMQSDDEVPAPAQHPPVIGFKFSKPYELLHSILCAYKAKQVIPGSAELPFDLCALMCKEEATATEKWSTGNCATYHKAVLSALRLVYPNKTEAWFAKPFLQSPTGAAKYWARVLTRRAQIWQAAADKKASTSLPPPYQEPLQDRIRRKIAERKAARINSLSRSFSGSRSKASAASSVRKQPSGLSSDSDETAATVIDLSQSPAASSASAPSGPSSASSTSGDSPPKAAPHPK